MRFLLIYAEIRDGFVKGYTGGYSEGAASICAQLKALGHEVHFIHLTQGKQIQKNELLERISRIKPDLIGFSVLSPSYWAVKQINTFVKEELGIKTVLGGPHAMFRYKQILAEAPFDFVAAGEGEKILPELLRRLENGGSVASLPGIATKDNLDAVVTQGCYVEDLDTLPIPDRSIFDFENLRESKERQAYFIAGRGCPFHCTYCPNLFKAKLLGTSKIRYKSPMRFTDEIVSVVQEHAFIQAIVFQDDILPLRIDWLTEFAGYYKERVGKPFICNVHPNLISEETCTLLSAMGCKSIVTGIETGSERIRREVLLRDISNAHLREKFALCKKYKLGISTYNMVGHYTETPEEALATIKLNAELKPVHSPCTIVIPYPGTRLNEICLKENGFQAGHEPEIYPEFTDTPIMKAGTLTPDQVVFFKKYFNILKALYQVLPQKWLDKVLTHPRFPYAAANRFIGWIWPRLVDIYLKYVTPFYNRYTR